MALRLKQEAFVAAYIGEANGNATEAARIAGYKGNAKTLGVVGVQNLANPSIGARIAEYRARIESEGLANQQNRVDAYNRRHRLLERIVAERAADGWLSDVPGGSTGFVVKQLKTVKHQYDRDPDDPDGKASHATVELWEAAVDTGLLNEFRQLEKQTAQDIGQWTEKREHSGPDGQALTIRVIYADDHD